MAQDPLALSSMARRRKPFENTNERTVWGSFDQCLKARFDKKRAVELYERLQAGQVALQDECYKVWLPLLRILGPQAVRYIDPHDRSEMLQAAAIYLLRLLVEPKKSPEVPSYAYVVVHLRKCINRLYRKVHGAPHYRVRTGAVPPHIARVTSHKQIEERVFLEETLSPLVDRTLARSRFAKTHGKALRHVLEIFFERGKVLKAAELAKRFRSLSHKEAKFLIEHIFVMMRLELLAIRKESEGLFDREWRWLELTSYVDEADFCDGPFHD